MLSGHIQKSVSLINPKQECIPGGCLPSAAVAVGGVGGRGCLPGDGGVCPGGVFAQVHAGIHITPLWTEFLTHACENITFPQLRLRTVKIVLKNT